MLRLVCYVTLSLYRSRQFLRAKESSGSHNSGQLAHAGDKVVRPMHWTPLPPQDTPSTHFC